MKALLFTIATMLLTSSAMAHPEHGHLSFAQGKLHAHLSWIQAPSSNGEAKMRLEWRDGESHEVVDPALPTEVVLWMPSMGHGSSPTQILPFQNELGEAVRGIFEVSRMYFVMAGPWDVQVKVKYADGQEETQAWAVEVAEDGQGGHHHH